MTKASSLTSRLLTVLAAAVLIFAFAGPVAAQGPAAAAQNQRSAASEVEPQAPVLAFMPDHISPGGSLQVTSSGWDPGTEVSFTVITDPADPANAPAATEPATSDSAGGLTPFDLAIPAGSFPAGGRLTLTASGMSGGAPVEISASATVDSPVVSPPPPPPTWKGSYNTFRAGSYSRQVTNYTCVAASIQMMVNIVRHTRDHSRRGQFRYLRLAKAGSLYTGDGGADPIGEAAALRKLGLGNYHVDLASSLSGAVHDAAIRIRATGKPVGLFVWHGGHAWVMTGFASDKDPRLGNDFKVTAVYVMGPLRQDPQANTRMSLAAFAHWLTSYRMPPSWWKGHHKFVVVLP